MKNTNALHLEAAFLNFGTTARLGQVIFGGWCGGCVRGTVG